MSRDEAIAMEGSGWSGDLDELRAPMFLSVRGNRPAGRDPDFEVIAGHVPLPVTG